MGSGAGDRLQIAQASQSCKHLCSSGLPGERCCRACYSLLENSQAQTAFAHVLLLVYFFGSIQLCTAQTLNTGVYSTASSVRTRTREYRIGMQTLTMHRAVEQGLQLETRGCQVLGCRLSAWGKHTAR